jgi:hypothetical protein
MNKKPLLGFLFNTLMGVILWSGIVIGGGVIENPLINTTISIIASLFLMNFVATFLTIIIIVIGLTGTQLLFGKSLLSIILQVIIALGSLVPSIYLTLTWLGKWLGFFPAYPTDTRWFIAVVLTIIALVVGLYQRKES